MHAPRSLAAVTAIAACLFVQACSESEETESSEAGTAPPAATQAPEEGLPGLPSRPKGIDACTMLTLQEVEDVIGLAIDGPETGPTAGGGRGEGKMSSCSYESSSETENAAPAELLAELDSTWFVNVTVWVWPAGGEAARNYIDGMRDAPMTDEPVREIKDLADEAVWNGTLHARKGDTTLSLDVRPANSADAPDELAKERALMEKALERL